MRGKACHYKLLIVISKLLRFEFDIFSRYFHVNGYTCPSAGNMCSHAWLIPIQTRNGNVMKRM